MKAWAECEDDAIEMLCDIGYQTGFEVKGRIEIYITTPDEPPREDPSAYDINFTPY